MGDRPRHELSELEWHLRVSENEREALASRLELYRERERMPPGAKMDDPTIGSNLDLKRRVAELELELERVVEENRALANRAALEKTRYLERESDLERQLGRIRRLWREPSNSLDYVADAGWRKKIEDELALLREVHPLRDYLLAVEGEVQRVESDLAMPGWRDLELASLN